MALNTQRYNYKGHDIYVFLSGSGQIHDNAPLHKDDSPYSYAIMVDGKVLGDVNPDMWFMKDSATFTLEDGVQLHVDAKARIFSEKVVLYADGTKLEPGERHNRNYENMRRLADGYDILCKMLGDPSKPMTDAQFLAVKSLSSPVLYSYAYNQASISSLPSTAFIKELHSDELLKQTDEKLIVPASLYLAQPGDYIEMMVGAGTEERPVGLYYDGFETYARSASIDIADTYLADKQAGFGDWTAGSMFTKNYAIDGMIRLNPSGEPIKGCLTSIDYIKELDELEEKLSHMQEDEREPFEKVLRLLITEDTTLSEFATVRDLAERGYVLTNELLMNIASKDHEWQEAMIQRYFDKQSIEHGGQEEAIEITK